MCQVKRNNVLITQGALDDVSSLELILSGIKAVQQAVALDFAALEIQVFLLPLFRVGHHSIGKDHQIALIQISL